MSEKRTPAAGNAQLPLALDGHQVGVGARQTPPALPPGGGGYLNECSGLNFEKKRHNGEIFAPRDPRLDDLQRMGLARVWMQIAEEIGVDAFLKLWRILDADPASWHNETILRVRLRPYRSYLRYQRNRFIESLAAQGMKPPEIQKRVRQQLGEDVSHRHITRLSKIDTLAMA